MAKRNSRVYADEPVFFDDSSYTSSSSSSYQSRRSSRSSFMMEDLFESAVEMEEGQRNVVPVKDAAAALRYQAGFLGAKDLAGLEKSAKLLPTIPQESEYPVVPSDGRPLNFGVIVPGFYRSSYPKQHDHDFIRGLKLKTIVTLVRKEEFEEELKSFVDANGIRHVTFDMKGTKKEAIPIDTMAAILQLTLDKRNYPLLIHCNHGKHRTGCVAAVVRRVAGWDLEPALDEYRTFASPKIRDCDIDYINAFQSSLIPRRQDEVVPHSPVQVRTFVRTLLFSTVVVVIWIVSGSQMGSSPAAAEGY